ncbi:hypothetical protein ACVIJW_007313 [Bradyrhizobium barranii subsp. barranii]
MKFRSKPVARVSTRQRAVLPPLFVNMNVHHVFDLWTHEWRSSGSYAGGSLMGFEIKPRSYAFSTPCVSE